jgi:hypothetical protein
MRTPSLWSFTSVTAGRSSDGTARHGRRERGHWWAGPSDNLYVVGQMMRIVGRYITLAGWRRLWDQKTVIQLASTMR